MDFIKKGWGRIFVATARTDIDPVQFVKDAIRELDEFEAGYLPKSEEPAFITLWDPEKPIELAFGFKFEMDIDKLTEFCWRAGVQIWCITQRHERWEGLPEPTTEETTA